MAASADYWQLTATDVLPLLQSGSLTVEAYARSLLSRIQHRDASVYAWVWLEPSYILQQAQYLDSLPASDRGPLHGLAVGVKDVILTRDQPTQFNSRIYTSDVPIGIDATIVASLRASGALILGKTTTTEFASTKQGNWHQNLTKNPHDPSRTPGGSSAGSGAAVGDFQVPIALGTQTGGSVIRPASFCGCYGFKPTYNAISREGLAQSSITLDTPGFFTRSVDDLNLLSDVLHIQDDTPPPSKPFRLIGAKIAFCKTPNWATAGPGTIAAMSRAQEILSTHGVAVTSLDLPADFDDILTHHATILTGEGRSAFLGHYLTDKMALHEEIQAKVENQQRISRAALLEAGDTIARLRPLWDQIAQAYDVVIVPSVVDEALLGLESSGDMSFNSMWTALHCPVLNLPGFVGVNGMPIGLTAVTARYRDRHLLHMAGTLGPLFATEGGWRRSNI